MKFWWVNQNQTYQHEVGGGYLWSPKTKANGDANPFYDTMTKVLPGDAVFSFCDTLIKAVGTVSAVAQSSQRPADFSDVKAPWSNDGWYVPVEFTALDQPIRPKDYIDQLRPLLPNKYSPLQKDGNGVQSVYLAEIPEAMAQKLIELLQGQVEKLLRGMASPIESQIAIAKDDQAIRERTDIGPTQKDQLIRARLGQGRFRKRVEGREKGCRVTSATSKAHLRASHIKPWKDCSDNERLDGANGLLLAPHVDHLFDRGFISFEQDGTVLVSPFLEPEIAKKWGLDLARNVGTFHEDQREYLTFHRTHRFLKVSAAH